MEVGGAVWMDGPSGGGGEGGRSRHSLRVQVMQMQTHEGRAGVGVEGKPRSLRLGGRVCASEALG